MSETTTIQQDWLRNADLQAILALLSSGDEKARVNGGAVRNALMGQAVSDVDISTTLVPSDVMDRLTNAGHKVIPTGIEHGTVTALVGTSAFEVTTLRKDVETDGRHAKVVFGTDWEADARRRDLTMNALYVDADGTIFDPLDGMSDVKSGTVRFIDDAETRIREDYLRILRFFRFFAWYGSFRPDADGLRAATRLKAGLSGLSAERVWAELIKLLAAPDPQRAILWMRQTGVLTAVLPESENWGVDTIPGLIQAEQENDWQADAVLRLLAMLPPIENKLVNLCDRMKLPNSVRDRLLNWAGTSQPDFRLKKPEFYKWLYTQNETAVADRLRLTMAASSGDEKKAKRQLKWLGKWKRPTFPVRGQDLLDAGMHPGPEISKLLGKIEARWIEKGFEPDAGALLKEFGLEQSPQNR